MAVYAPSYADAWVKNAAEALAQANTRSGGAVRLTRAQNIYFVIQVMTGRGF